MEKEHDGFSAGSGPGKRRFVLVVDSDPADANHTAVLLQNFGYTSATVRSGEEAMDFLAVASPALIITELTLPGMNGFDLFDRIRRAPRLTAIPVIIQTKHGDLEGAGRCRRIGCGAYLNKPVPSEVLYQAVQQAIEPTPRQNIRVHTFLKASIDGAASGGEFVTELSDGGLFVQTLEPRPEGSRHTVTFLLEKKIIGIDAVVLYVCRIGEGPDRKSGMGMKYVNLSPVDREMIQEYVRLHVKPPHTSPHGR